MTVSVRANTRRLVWQAAPRTLKLRSVVALLAVVIVSALFYAYTTVRVFDLSYQVSRELETQRELRETERRLMVELNHLSSPQRLEREGDLLGLKPPAEDQLRRLP